MPASSPYHLLTALYLGSDVCVFMPQTASEKHSPMCPDLDIYTRVYNQRSQGFRREVVDSGSEHGTCKWNLEQLPTAERKEVLSKQPGVAP